MELQHRSVSVNEVASPSTPRHGDLTWSHKLPSFINTIPSSEISKQLPISGSKAYLRDETLSPDSLSHSPGPSLGSTSVADAIDSSDIGSPQRKPASPNDDGYTLAPLRLHQFNGKKSPQSTTSCHEIKVDEDLLLASSDGRMSKSSSNASIARPFSSELTPVDRMVVKVERTTSGSYNVVSSPFAAPLNELISSNKKQTLGKRASEHMCKPGTVVSSFQRAMASRPKRARRSRKHSTPFQSPCGEEGLLLVKVVGDIAPADKPQARPSRSSRTAKRKGQMTAPVAPRAKSPQQAQPRKRSSHCSGVSNFMPDGTRKVCKSCGVKQTPYWRDGWAEGVCLCNACGIRFKKRKVACESCFYVPRKDEKQLDRCPKCQSGLFIS